MTEPNLTERALRFAVDHHLGQTRKHSGAPYSFHPVEVAKGVADAGIHDHEILAAALLHDVVEDTHATHQDMIEHLGERVAEMVNELTHDEETDSKEAYLRTFASASEGAIAVKLLDRYCNVRDYSRDRPDYAPIYAGKAAELYAAVDARASDLESAFGARAAEQLLKLCDELKGIE